MADANFRTNLTSAAIDSKNLSNCSRWKAGSVGFAVSGLRLDVILQADQPQLGLDPVNTPLFVGGDAG